MHMKKVVFVLISIILVVAFVLFLMNRAFNSKFQKLTDKIRGEAGSQDQTIISESDLMNLPPPVSKYIKVSGLIGKKRISFMRIWHSGTFRLSKDKDFLPITGEYFLTTRKPSFTWLGKISMFPGFSIAARDSYFNGKGNMIVKIMSAIKIVDAKSEIVDRSAYGRCIAEMTMCPSFFLDQEHVKWIKYDSDYAECVVSDAGLSTKAQLFFKTDGTLEKFVVDRYFDRGNGEGTLEKFVSMSKEVKDFNGLRINTVYDGYWNLPEGDLHYVHFIIDRVETE
jgi:hypothetical protein